MAQRTGGFGRRSASSNGAAPQRLKRPTDKRQGDRAAAFRTAKVYISGNTELNCAVRDVSDKGCMVSLLGAENLPNEVTVRLGAGRPRQRARVVWIDGQDAGLEFLQGDEV